MTTTTLYLIRHAEAEGNLYRRIHGQYDSLVTPNGYRQLDALAQRFAQVPLDAVYSSDLFRTRVTAGAVCRGKGLVPKTCSGLREIDLGGWEDIPWGQVSHFEPQQLKSFLQADPQWQAPGGENYAQLQARMVQAVRQILRSHPGQTVAVVSHGTAIRSFQAYLHGLPLSQSSVLGHCDNTGVTCIEFCSGGAKPLFENDNSHLSQEISTLAGQRWWRDGSAEKDANIWYQPLDMKTQGDLFRTARREAWRTIHGSMEQYQEEAFFQDALRCWQQNPRSIMLGMLGGTAAGVIHMDLERDADKGIGAIPFYYMMPQFRRKGLGIQLLGQAISTYRPLGREYIRLRCAPDNHIAQRFYRRHGFHKVGEALGSRVPLDVMEKYIGFRPPQEGQLG